MALWGAAANAETAARVVSINLCTDQLALMVAAPGQLVSVSEMSHDPRGSAMAEAAQALPGNVARAEEVMAMAPDLVLAGRFSSGPTVAMLTRLGVRVEVFEPANSIDDIRANITKMGAVLGREATAAQIVAAFDADLAALRDSTRMRPRAALYFANGYTSGAATLAGQIVEAAGFDNVAPEAGFMPLEMLAMSNPDIVITGQPYAGASRSEDIMRHPIVAAFHHGAVTDRDWVCGTPHIVRAVRALRAERLAIEAAQ